MTFSIEGGAFVQFHVAGDLTMKAGHQLEPRQIPDYELVYFPGGTKATYTVDGQVFDLHKPSVLITPPGLRHAYAFDPSQPTRHLFIHFDLLSPLWKERFPQLLGDHPPIVDLDDHSVVPPLIKQILHYFHQRPERWKGLTEMLFLAVLEELEASLLMRAEQALKVSVPAQIANVLQYIEDHLQESITVECLVDMTGWSHEHFTRVFQRCLGYTPKQWMNKRKVELSAQLLLHSSDNVKEIAYRVGYQDVYYFYRLFRKWMGLTTTEYRRKYGDPRLRDMAPVDDRDPFYPKNRFFILRRS